MLPTLVEECTKYLWRDLYPRNACRAYEFARLFEEPILMEKSIQMICTQTREILSESTFEVWTHLNNGTDGSCYPEEVHGATEQPACESPTSPHPVAPTPTLTPKINTNTDINQSINQSCISGLFHSILLPDHSWQIIEINQGQT